MFDNQLTGTLPSFAQLTRLTFLCVSANALSGTIPSDIGQLTGLRFLGVQQSATGGTVPLSFSSLRLLTYEGFHSGCVLACHRLLTSVYCCREQQSKRKNTVFLCICWMTALSISPPVPSSARHWAFSNPCQR